MTFQSVKKDSKTCTRTTSNKASLKAGYILNLGTLNISSDIVSFAGSGTEEDPYQISDLQELKYLATVTNKGETDYLNPYYIQTEDIDCNGETLTPIGNVQYKFAGKYNGNNKKISNAVFGHFESEDKAASGLFGNLYNAAIQNVILENCTVKDYGETSNPEIIFGLLAAHAYSSSGYKCTISGCKTTGTVSFNSRESGKGAYQVGGLIGASNANIDISRCTNDASFDSFYLRSLAHPSMGGILGYAGPVQSAPDGSYDADAHVRIDRCRNTGTLTYYVDDPVNYTGVAVGGILGRAYDGWSHETIITVRNCVNNGTVGELNETSSDVKIGGIVGENDSDGSSSELPSIFNCLNKGIIYCKSTEGNVGGIVGFNYNKKTTVSMCMHNGNFLISTSDNLLKGAICGSNAVTFLHVFYLGQTDLSLAPNISSVDDGNGTGYSSGKYSLIPQNDLESLIAKCYSESEDMVAWKSTYGRVYDLDF